jgi:hypothetical protein
MNVTDKMVEAAFRTIRLCPSQMLAPTLRKAIEAAMQAAPAVEQEPVMYELRIRMLPDGDFDSWAICSKKVYEHHKSNPIDGKWEHEIRALYTNPQPKREPLSEENLVLIWNSSTKDIPYEHFQAIFRFTEKAHGIGV